MHPNLAPSHAKESGAAKTPHALYPKTQIYIQRTSENAKKYANAHSEPSTKQSLLNPREKAAVTLAMVLIFIHKRNKQCSSPWRWREETKVEVKNHDQRPGCLRKVENLGSVIVAGIKINLY